MVRLDIAGLKNGTRNQSLDLEPEDLELESEEFEGIHLDVELDREGDRILVRYDVSGTAHLICDRTSEPFSQEVRGTHFLLFVPHDRVDAMGGDDDVLGFEPSDSSIDVTEAVRDTLLLSVPVRKIAPGAEDLEIQTRFGEDPDEDDEVIDPRWEALKKLRDQQN